MNSDMNQDHIRILFTGYAYSHFVCFRPLYEYFVCQPNIEVYVSGGLRTKTDCGYNYNPRQMYRDLGVDDQHILRVDQIKQQDFDLLFSAHTKLILPRSVKKIIQIFHGVSFRNRAIRPKNFNCDYYFIVGPYMQRLCLEADLFQENDPRAVPIGFMKTDRLLNGELVRDRLLTEYDLSGDRPILLYAPTGLNHNSLEIMGEKIIRNICAADKYDLLIKLHDHPKKKDIDWTTRLKSFLGPHCRISSEKDIIPLLFISDLLITDASSVSNEYSLLDRPIVFMDVPKLLAKASKKKDSLLDIDTWGRRCGIVVKKPAQIEDAIEYSLMNNKELSRIRLAMAHDIFYNQGFATSAAISWLDKMFKGVEEKY